MAVVAVDQWINTERIWRDSLLCLVSKNGVQVELVITKSTSARMKT